MLRGLKPVAWLLLAIALAFPVVAQVSSLAALPPPAGCDEHGGTMPFQPASYTCCQGGHDTAALQEAFSLRAVPGHVSSALDSPASPVISVDLFLTPLPLPSDSPPLSISLRI